MLWWIDQIHSQTLKIQRGAFWNILYHIVYRKHKCYNIKATQRCACCGTNNFISTTTVQQAKYGRVVLTCIWYSLPPVNAIFQMVLHWDNNDLTHSLLSLWWCHPIYWLLILILLLPPACWIDDPPNKLKLPYVHLTCDTLSWFSVIWACHVSNNYFMLCDRTRYIGPGEINGYHDALGCVRADHTYLPMNRSFSSLSTANPPLGR